MPLRHIGQLSMEYGGSSITVGKCMRIDGVNIKLSRKIHTVNQYIHVLHKDLCRILEVCYISVYEFFITSEA